MLRSAAILAVLAAGLAGCSIMDERHFEMQAGDLVRLAPVDPARPVSVRHWLADAHGRLRFMLPPEHTAAMLTDDLVTADGQPADVLGYFGRTRGQLNSALLNFYGMRDTIQSLGQNAIPNMPAPDWEGFEDVWIPIRQGLELSGRIGLVRDAEGKPTPATCIVLLPGFWGDNWVYRSYDVATALLANGFHVLALEQRGMGNTDLVYPDVPYMWGVLEAGDLLTVSEWLTDKPYVPRTGLMGYCWGANQVLVLAWYEGAGLNHPGVTDYIASKMRPVGPRRHYTAGVMAFSPTLHTEKLIDACDTPRTFLEDPAVGGLQSAVADRMALRGYPGPQHSLRNLICQEAARSEMDSPITALDGIRFLRLLPHRGLPAFDKMDHARMPVLIVNASNDMLAHAQDVAELISRTDNPNVAAVITDGGGHLGFPSYSRNYYYSLIMNFFDPARGPSAGSPPERP